MIQSSTVSNPPLCSCIFQSPQGRGFNSRVGHTCFGKIGHCKIAIHNLSLFSFKNELSLGNVCDKLYYCNLLLVIRLWNPRTLVAAQTLYYGHLYRRPFHTSRFWLLRAVSDADARLLWWMYTLRGCSRAFRLEVIATARPFRRSVATIQRMTELRATLPFCFLFHLIWRLRARSPAMP